MPSPTSTHSRQTITRIRSSLWSRRSITSPREPTWRSTRIPCPNSPRPPLPWRRNWVSRPSREHYLYLDLCCASPSNLVLKPMLPFSRTGSSGPQLGRKRLRISAFASPTSAEALTIGSATNKQEHATTSESDAGIRPRLVFIVDELDRCRPTFALAVLERIKHIFGVQGVTFLLVANLKELGKSVLKVYGDVDETRYLEKFFEIVVRLPESTPGGHRLTTRAYVHHLSKQLRLPRNNAYGHRYLDFLCALAEAENLSLRSLEHTMRLALVLAPSAPAERWSHCCPILRIARPKLFDRILQMAQEPLTAEEKSELGDLARPLGRGRP